MGRQSLIVGIIALIALVGGTLVFWQLGEKGAGQEKMMEDKSAMEANPTAGDNAAMQKEGQEKESMVGSDEAMTHGGTYEAYRPEKIAWAAHGDVVLYFRAAWCPICKALDADIRNNLSAIPKNLTILDVDYDSETALKQKYGVTYQHTFVQVDESGKQIAKWSGSQTLEALILKVQ